MTENEQKNLIKLGRKFYKSDPERRKKQAEYNKRWKQAHPEKQKEYTTRFYLHQAEKAMQAENAKKGN